jgi:hypothetical protein
VISSRQLLFKLAGTNGKRWIWIGLAAVPAIRIYYVREMIAALIIFSVLFVAVATVVLIVFLLDRASEYAVTWAEVGVARLIHRSKAASHGDTAFGKVAH